MNVPQLVAEIKQRTPLWDRAHELRHERALIEGLWEEVAILMGHSAKSVKGKWKTLKDTYRKEAKKCVNDPNYRSPWAHYSSLSFLFAQLGIDNNVEVLADQSSSSSVVENDSKIEFVYENIENIDLPVDNESVASSSRGTKRKREDSVDEDQSRSEYDEEDLFFFKSLMPHVKQLSPQRKMLLRMKIQELVYKEVYANDTQY